MGRINDQDKGSPNLILRKITDKASPLGVDTLGVAAKGKKVVFGKFSAMNLRFNMALIPPPPPKIYFHHYPPSRAPPLNPKR